MKQPNPEKFLVKESIIEVPESLREFVARRKETLPMLLELAKINHEPTIRHSEEVALCCLELAKQIKLSEKERDQLVLSGYLHDVGKNGVDRGIVEKREELTPAERAEMDEHSEKGMKILSEAMPDIASIVAGHHQFQERKPNGSNVGQTQNEGDGSNRKNGESKDDPEAERIKTMSEMLALVDQFHSLIDPKRPYREAASIEKAKDELTNNNHFSDSAKTLLETVAKYFKSTGKYKFEDEPKKYAEAS